MRSAAVAVDLDGAGDARVEATYLLEGVVSGEALPLRVLGFGGPFAVGGAAGGRDGAELTRAQGELWTASIVVPRAGPGGSGRVELSYTVPGAAVALSGAVRATIPLITVDLPPADPRPGLFVADLRVPSEWSVREGFPTGMWGAETPGHHRVELQVVPSMLALRGRTDGATRPGLPELLDALAVLLLVALCAVGWRHMTREAA